MNFTLASDQQVHDELCRRLKLARINAEMTQDELAERSGNSRNSIGRMERGEISPTLASVIAILRALGLIEQLDSFLPPPPPSPIQKAKGSAPAKQRVRKKRKSTSERASGWRWGDE